jgi:hypothetical protein
VAVLGQSVHSRSRRHHREHYSPDEAAGPDGKRQHTVAEIAEAAGGHRTIVYDYLNLQRRPI